MKHMKCQYEILHLFMYIIDSVDRLNLLFSSVYIKSYTAKKTLKTWIIFSILQNSTCNFELLFIKWIISLINYWITSWKFKIIFYAT
jgi:hypothetical protein